MVRISMQMLMTFDDFLPLDSLTKASKRNKISAVYFTIDNISYSFQSKRKDINILLLAYRNHVDAMSFSQFLSDFLKINQNGIKLSNGYTVKLVLDKEVADNLALNELRKITTCFGSKACPWRDVKYVDLQKQKDFNLKERSNAKEDVFKVLNDNDKYLFCPHMFHDLPEGILKDFNKYFLNKHYKDEFEIFNEMQKRFKLKHGNILFSKINCF